jgi:D-xylose transport system substrate-binding protein
MRPYFSAHSDFQAQHRSYASVLPSVEHRRNLLRRAIFRFVALFCASVAFLSAQFAFAQTAKIKIGFSIEAMNGERWQTDLNSFETRAKELGAEVISADAKGDDDRQLQQVQDMIKSGIKALVLLPHDTTKAIRIVEAARAANVKVVSYDRMVLNSDVDLYITFDRAAIGQMQAESLLKQAPKGNYAILAGSPQDGGAKSLHTAQMKVLQPAIDRGDVKVISDSYINDWLPSEAYMSTLKAIESSKGNIAAIVASNDGLAGGAIQALRENNLAGKVAVSGQDADLAAIICIAQGTQTMTVYKPVTQQALKAAEEAVRLARGMKPDTTSFTNNGKKEVPSILLKPIAVTKDNIKSTVVKDGFQKLQSINQALSPEQQIK